MPRVAVRDRELASAPAAGGVAIATKRPAIPRVALRLPNGPTIPPWAIPVEQVEFGRKRAAKGVGVEVKVVETREPADLRDERARKPILVNLKLAEPREQAKLSRQRAGQ